MISEFFEHPRWNMLYVACTLLFLVLGIVWGLRANDEKMIRANDVVQRTDAVIIANISVGDRSVECGLFVKPDYVQPVTPFQADGDWLQKMSITLINRTNKTIVRGGVLLQFLDTGDCSTSQPCAMDLLQLGRVPPVNAYDGRTGAPLKPEHPERPVLDWKPYQTIVLRAGDFMDEIAATLSNRLSVSNVDRVAVHPGAFYFEDGMCWSAGRFSVPDLEHPGRFKKLPVDYFPGHMGLNWPPGYNQ